jgi:uncharacterized integral membrane protein
MELAKKYFLPAALILFLVIIFLDQNNAQVPMKVIIGSPIHMPLSMIIMLSMVVGAVCALGGYFLLRGVSAKLKRNDRQD